MSADIWMPLYIGDYLKHTKRLSTLEHGAYLLLIMDYWVSGHIDNDDEQLARITGLSIKDWVKIKPKITAFFVLVECQWRHARIEEELTIAQDKKFAAHERAIKGGQATKAYWTKINSSKR